MAKFKVGDEVAIATVVKITAIQPTVTGKVSYSTDRGFCIHEVLMDEIALKTKEPKKEEPNPAHVFKVGDRVTNVKMRFRAGEIVGIGKCGLYMYHVYDDDGHDWFCSGDSISPERAPEPKLYTGRVFALKPDCPDGSSGMLNRIGRVFEIKNGELQGETLKYDMSGYVQIKSFSDFCRLACATVWCEVID